MHFADRLHERMNKVGSRLVIGIDPDAKRLFGEKSSFQKANPGLSNQEVLDAFCADVIEAAQDTACAVKPQAAFFESMGLWGYKSLGKCIRAARFRGIPVILDAKRADIGNTATAYASAYFDPSSDYFADAMTVNPYLGPDTLEPFTQAASKAGSGLFVLVKTSNPGSGAFQDTVLADGRTLYMKVAQVVQEIGQSYMGDCGYSDIGMVIGATYPEQLAELRKVLPTTTFLVPGYGAQGGTAEDVRGAFNADGYGAVVSSSRGVIFAYEKLGAGATYKQIRESMVEAAIRAKEDIRKVTPST